MQSNDALAIYKLDDSTELIFKFTKKSDLIKE